MEDERDILTLTDDDGNELELEILRYFFYNGEEYAMVTDFDEDARDCYTCDKFQDDEECDCEPMEIFFMKVEPVDEENEEYTFVDEELSNTLMNIIQTDFDETEDEEDEDGQDA